MSSSLKSVLGLVAAMAVAGAVHAHDCSGGAGGGMDATGNECGMAADVVSSSYEPAKMDRPAAGAEAAKATTSNATVAMNRPVRAKHHSPVRQASGGKRRAHG